MCQDTVSTTRELQTEKLETEIVHELSTDAKLTEAQKDRGAFATYTNDEKDYRMKKMEEAINIADYEEKVKDGYLEEMDTTKFAKATEATHVQVENEYKNLSWSQKRKLKKRQQKYVDAAKGIHLDEATELTLPLLTSRSRAIETANSHMENLSTDDIVELNKQKPDESLFDAQYKNDEKKDLYKDCPYDLVNIHSKLAELEFVSEKYEQYIQDVKSATIKPDLLYEARCKAQEKVRISLGKAMESLYLSNGVNIGALKYLNDKDVFDKNNAPLEKKAHYKKFITSYEKIACNFDNLLETEKRTVVDNYREMQLAGKSANFDNSSQDYKDVKLYEHPFFHHPPKIDSMRDMLNDPAANKLITKNSIFVQRVWKEYIRNAFTIDEKNANLEMTFKKEGFEKMSKSDEEDLAKLEHLAKSYEEILRNLALGDKMSGFSDVIARSLFGIETDYRRDIELQYPGTASTEVSLKIRNENTLISNQRIATAGKYYDHLPANEVNKKMDSRMVTAFCKGWKIDEDGNPATEEDRETMEHETHWIKSMFGVDVEARHAAIDEYLDEYINMQITPKMLTKDYILKNHAEIKHILHIGLNYDGLKKGDPQYFDSLSDEKKAQIDVAAERSMLICNCLNYRLLAVTGVDQSNNYITNEMYEQYTTIADAVELEAKDSIFKYDQKLKDATFDAKTDNFSKEEYKDLLDAFFKLSPERFFQKLEKRKKLGLPVDDLLKLFGCTNNMTTDEYYESIINPQYTDEQIEKMKDSGFGGMVISFPDFAFGSDDWAAVNKIVKKISAGGADAEEYGCDEETAIAFKKVYENFKQESLENAKVKTKFNGLDDFDVPFMKAKTMLKGKEAVYGEMLSKINQYASKAKVIADDIYKKMSETDQKMRNGSFLDMIRIMCDKNISFIQGQTETLTNYMNNPSIPLELTQGTVQDADGEALTVYGQEAMEIVTSEMLAQKKNELKDGYPAFLQSLKTLIGEANALQIDCEKYTAVARNYHDELDNYSNAESDVLNLNNHQKTLLTELEKARNDASQEEINAAETAYNAAVSEYQLKKQEFDSLPKAGSNNPVFSHIDKSKRTFMQFELNFKGVVKETDYNAKVEEINHLING